jgi:uncharacterized membrane protein YbhN (UPF0104 family)
VAALAQRRLGLLNAAFSLAALAGIIWWARRQHAPQVELQAGAVAELVTAIALYGVVTLLRAERWRSILVHNGIPRGRGDVYGLTVVGYMANNTLPARAGDLLRVVLVGGSRRAALGTVVAERVLDALALAAIFLVVVLDRGASFGPLPYVLGAGIFAIAVLAVVWCVSDRVSNALRPIVAASRGLVSLHGAWLLALSVVLWGVEASVYHVVGLAVGVHLGVAGALYVVALTNLSALIPAGPGYVGTFDAAVLLALRSLHKSALGYLLVLRFVLFVPITIVGAAVYFTRYARRRR